MTVIPKRPSLSTIAAAFTLSLSLTTGIRDISLGKPTDAVNLDNPLFSYRPGAPTLTRDRKPELLFIGSYYEGRSDVERWPVVKALQQFGTFSGLRGMDAGAGGAGEAATIDWTYARYRSTYVSFVHTDLYDANGHHLQLLPTADRTLLKRYATSRYPYVSDPLLQRVIAPTFPVVLVGGYVMAGSGLGSGELSADNATLSFTTVERALQAGYTHHFVQYVFDIDAEANAVTALICHADHLQPASVCRRPTIKAILKHVH